MSRFDETPDFLAVELRDGDYVSLGTSTAVAIHQAKVEILRAAPSHRSGAVTVEELTKKIGARRTSAQEAIKELIGERKLLEIGKGVKGSPHRYFKQIDSAETVNIGAAR
jgi:hypothetical protein